MRVEDVMIQNVKFCSPEMNLAAAAAVLWKAGCGTLPVVENERVIGVITDRDIAIALGTRDAKASEITVGDVSLPKLFSTSPGEDIHSALRTMAEQKVRRLPVLDNKGALRGILCLDDVIIFAEQRGDLTYADVVMTLKSICQHTTALQTLAANL
jgi:CBS domain-containing protein